MNGTGLIAAAFLLGALACDGKPVRSAGPRWATKPLPVYHIGAQVSGLALYDARGTSCPLEAGRGRVVVLEFWSPRCPVVQKTEKARRRLVEAYAPRGLAYFAIDSNRDEPPSEMKEYLKESGSSYTVLVDYGGEAAARFNVGRTPHAFVLDRQGIVRYAGPLFSPEQLNRSEPKRADWLEAAVEALLENRTPDPPLRPASGTLIRKFIRE